MSLAAAEVALADADPASDALYVGTLFEPYPPNTVSTAIEAQLLAAIRKSKAAGKEVRVALVASRKDLGGVPALFGKPTQYARFLAAELQFVYPGRVLIVMPQGAGLARNGRLIADRTVISARPEPGADGLARTATELVGAISETGTVATERSSSSGIPAWAWAGIVVTTMAAIGGVGGVIVARRRRSWQH